MIYERDTCSSDNPDATISLSTALSQVYAYTMSNLETEKIMERFHGISVQDDLFLEDSDENRFLKLTRKPVEEDHIVNIIQHGLDKSLRVVALIMRFISRTRHAVHMKKNIPNEECALCKTNAIDNRLEIESLGIIPSQPLALRVCSLQIMIATWLGNISAEVLARKL